MASVPTSAAQRRHAHQVRSWKRPDHQGMQNIPVTIEEVYDPEYFENNSDAPEKLKMLIVREPGTLFAKVKSDENGVVMIVGFRESPSYILNNEGNGLSLKGRKARIFYKGFEPRNGRLVLSGDRKLALRNNARESHLFDISGLISA